jgi:biopolymer transport protein ExbB
MPNVGNYGGMAYKGGFIVPILMGMLLMVFVFSIERLIVIGRATGKGSLDAFVKRIQSLLSQVTFQQLLQNVINKKVQLLM